MVVARRRRTDRPLVRLLKWAIMLICIFWMMVYRLGTAGGGIQEFLYVNF